MSVTGMFGSPTDSKNAKSVDCLKYLTFFCNRSLKFPSHNIKRVHRYVRVQQHNMSDRLLVEKILAGDTRLFSLIVDDTERLVAQIVRKLVDDDQDQQDLAQDIYLKVYQKLSTFRFQAKLSTWIAQIAYHTCCTHLEKKKVPLDRLGLEHEHELTQLNDTPAEQFAPETQALMLAELEKLPPLYKMLISLYHLEELSNREISVITNLPEGTIKSYLFRARKQLKERLNASHKKYRL